MATLLELVNTVLQKIGENRVGTVNHNVVSRLCAANVATALNVLVDESTQWPWLEGDYQAASWSTDTATLPGTVVNIEYIRDAGSQRIVQYMDTRTFSLRTPTAYTGTHGGACWWSMLGQNIRFDPYPNDADSRNNIFFHGSVVLAAPTANSDVIQIPDRDLNMLVFRVCALMATDHLQDRNRAEMYLMEYSKAVQMAKSRMNGDPQDRRRSAIW